jgi:hypothetical protein
MRWRCSSVAESEALEGIVGVSAIYAAVFKTTVVEVQVATGKSACVRAQCLEDKEVMPAAPDQDSPFRFRLGRQIHRSRQRQLNNFCFSCRQFKK